MLWFFSYNHSTWKKILRNIRLVFQGNSCLEIRKTYFWAPKWGVNLYTGSTYTQVNTVYNIDITEFVQPKVITRSTRHSCSLDYQPLKCRTSLFRRSYFNRTVKLWNSLSLSIRTLPSINAFKAAVVNYYKKALIETFDQDNVYTWKSFCLRSFSIRNLSSFHQYCF